MAGQAMVTIKDKQWNVTIANTLAELTTGLSEVSSVPAQTGMLFDLGYDQKYIEIDMSRMLFPLDIIFINSTRGVVGVMHNVQPSETDVRLENERVPGARCFLEVNAGEAQGIEVGDGVAIEGYAQPAQFNIASLINLMVTMMAVVGLAKMVGKAIAPPQERPALLPQTSKETRGKLPQTIRDYDEELEQLRRDFREGTISEENYMRAVKEILARKHQPKVTPREKPERKPPGELEYLADTPEFLAQTIEATGYRQKLDTAFQEAIARAKELP